MQQAESSLFEQHARLAKRDHFVLCPHADLHPIDIGETTMVSLREAQSRKQTMKITCLLAALLLVSSFATQATAHVRTDRSSYRAHVGTRPTVGSWPQGYGIEGREVAAPPWSFACINDQGPQQCDEPMWVYGSPDYLAQFKNAF
jgi:hypothetical protein